MKKNVLFVFPFLPYPLQSGGHQAMFNGLMAVRDYVNVYITYPVGNNPYDEDIAGLKRQVGFNCWVLPYGDNGRKRLLKKSLKDRLVVGLKKQWQRCKPNNQSISNEKSYSHWIFQLNPVDSNYAIHVNSIIAQYKIDVVQCEMIPNLPLGLSLPKDVKKIFVHHELLFVCRTQETNRDVDSLEKQVYLRYLKLKEIGLLNCYDSVIVFSDLDKQLLIENGVTVPIKTSPCVVGTNVASTPNNITPYVLSFVGSGFHGPNVQGLNWFLNNCWEAILSSEPNYQLKIIGLWPEKIMTDVVSSYTHVQFTGFVENLKMSIGDTVMIVPITVGSGIRMKILEAFSLGIPVVSTTIGADGLLVENGKHCLIADSADDFVKAIRISENDRETSRMVVNAKRLIKDCYSMEKMSEERVSILEELIEG